MLTSVSYMYCEPALNGKHNKYDYYWHVEESGAFSGTRSLSKYCHSDEIVTIQKSRALFKTSLHALQINTLPLKKTTHLLNIACSHLISTFASWSSVCACSQCTWTSKMKNNELHIKHHNQCYLIYCQDINDKMACLSNSVTPTGLNITKSPHVPNDVKGDWLRSWWNRTLSNTSRLWTISTNTSLHAWL